MAGPRSLRLLHELLEGKTPLVEDVDGIIRSFEAQRELEGQWFDLKAGAVVQNKQAADIRKAVCGFANAEGGFLLIGYDESCREYDGVAVVNGHAPEHWITDALGTIASRIAPPRYTTLQIAGKEVLLVAIAPSSQQIAFVVEDGAPVYYLRFGHQTRPMPQSLLADLQLGRRSRPQLELEIGTPRLRVLNEYADVDGSWDIPLLEVTVTANISNGSLCTAEDVRIGMVAPTPCGSGVLIAPALARSVEVQPFPLGGLRAMQPWRKTYLPTTRNPSPNYWHGPRIDLHPFDVAVDSVQSWKLPVLPFIEGPPITTIPGAQAAERVGALEVLAAVFALARNAEPAWYELAFRYDRRITALQDSSGASNRDEELRKHLKLTPCPYSRPRVSVRFLNVGEEAHF